jgi:hypothetical protein
MSEGRTGGMKRLRRLAWVGGIVSVLLIGIVSVLLILTAVAVTLEALGVGEAIGLTHPTDPGVAFATSGLAVFTGLLFFAGAVAAVVAAQEIYTTTDVNSANLALQLDNRAHSDRALRIRHGAVSYLVETREDLKELKAEFACDAQDISPYSNQEPWRGLNSDLIDLFNYFDWIGYLTSERPRTIHLEVVYRKFGPWIINYYQLCKEELEEDIMQTDPARWPYLKRLYYKLIAIEEAYYDEGEYSTEPFPGARTHEELKHWLRREHVRSHRGSDPKPRSAAQDPSTSF